MAQFVMDEDGPAPPRVAFRAKIDSDGDFTVYANDRILFWIDCDAGEIVRPAVVSIDGIKRDRHDRIAVREEP